MINKKVLLKSFIKRCLLLAVCLGVIMSPHAFAKSDTNTKSELVVYTYESFSAEYGAGPKIKDLFEDSCECQVRYVGLTDANLILSRVLLEGGRTNADIVLGIDNNLLKKAEVSGLFAAHKIKIPPSNFQLADELDSKLFLPFDYGWLAFVYSSKHLKNPPADFDELLNKPTNTRFLVLQDPRTSSPGLSFLVWAKELYPDDFTTVLKKIDQKTITYTKGWGEAYQMFLNNEAQMVFSYITSPLYHILLENRFDIKVWDSKAGFYMQVEYAGILKSSKNPDLGRRFLKFLISPKAQKLLPLTQWMYPVAPTELPVEFEKAKPKKTLWPKALSDKEVKQLVKEWSNALSQP